MDKLRVSHARLIKMVGRPGHVPPRDYELVCRDGGPRCEVRFTVSSTGCHSALSCVVSSGGTQSGRPSTGDKCCEQRAETSRHDDRPSRNFHVGTARSDKGPHGRLPKFFFCFVFRGETIISFGCSARCCGIKFLSPCAILGAVTVRRAVSVTLRPLWLSIQTGSLSSGLQVMPAPPPLTTYAN